MGEECEGGGRRVVSGAVGCECEFLIGWGLEDDGRHRGIQAQ